MITKSTSPLTFKTLYLKLVLAHHTFTGKLWQKDHHKIEASLAYTPKLPTCLILIYQLPHSKILKPQRVTTFAVSEPCLWSRFPTKEQFMVVIVKLGFNRFSNELNSGLRDYHCSNIPSKRQGPSVNYQGQPFVAWPFSLCLFSCMHSGKAPSG